VAQSDKGFIAKGKSEASTKVPAFRHLNGRFAFLFLRIKHDVDCLRVTSIIPSFGQPHRWRGLFWFRAESGPFQAVRYLS
jgi:hypothetical protein